MKYLIESINALDIAFEIIKENYNNEHICIDLPWSEVVYYKFKNFIKQLTGDDIQPLPHMRGKYIIGYKDYHEDTIVVTENFKKYDTVSSVIYLSVCLSDSTKTNLFKIDSLEKTPLITNLETLETKKIIHEYNECEVLANLPEIDTYENIVFICSTSKSVESIYNTMKTEHNNVFKMHSGMVVKDRINNIKCLKRFNSKFKGNILVTESNILKYSNIFVDKIVITYPIEIDEYIIYKNKANCINLDFQHLNIDTISQYKNNSIQDVYDAVKVKKINEKWVMFDDVKVNMTNITLRKQLCENIIKSENVEPLPCYLQQFFPNNELIYLTKEI